MSQNPFQYVKCLTGDQPPKNALEGGFDSRPSYHARGFVDGKTIPGKVGLDINGCLKGACIPYGGRENRIDSFDVLTSEWNTSYVRCRTGDQPPKKAVIGGHDEGPSYHARAKIPNGKTIPGKVGVTREKDGDLKGACVPYGGKEYRINDFEVLVIDDTISHVEFQVDKAKMLATTPKVIAQNENRNDSSETQTIEFSFSKTITNSFTFTHQAGVSISVGTKFKCGLPLVGEAEVEVAISGSYSYTWGESMSQSQSFEAKFPVKAGPKSTVICKALVNETKLEVPYIVHLKSGNTSSGVWHGTSSWGLQATYH